jgi:small subunit ribosomal protein S8
MSNDLVADSLTRIRNGQKRGKGSVNLLKSSLVRELVEVLKKEGFLSFVEERTDIGKYPVIQVGLKYYPNGRPMIAECRRVSKGGRRVYAKATELEKIRAGLGISVVSTSQGVLTDREARQKGIGGEVLATIS